MTDTTLRYIKMLDCLPTQPRKTTAKDIQSRLAEAGHDISVRSVERDLEKLAAVFPLCRDDRNRPYGWSWMANASRVDIQPIDPVSALTLMLARDHLAPLLPASVLKVLAPRFEAAERLLAGNGTSSNDLARLATRIRVKSRGQRLAPPVVDHALLEQLYEALQSTRRVALHYGARKHDGQAKSYQADPLGLVFVDGVVYFVCRLQGTDGTHVAHLPVQRIRSVALLDEPVIDTDGFELDRYVDEKFDYPVGDAPLKLVFRMEAATAAHLAERPLAADQVIGENDTDGFVSVQATVADTQQLRWWLLAFGDKVEVLAPATLRAEFAATAGRLAAAYR